jgi:hypothetical protein
LQEPEPQSKKHNQDTNNIVPRQQTAGPSNKNPDDILQDLAAANTEIEQLRALLANQEILSSETEILNSGRLASILEVLSQYLARAEFPAASTKSIKIPDLSIFTNRKDFTFENWKF